MSVIQVQNLTKTYNENTVPVHALNDVNLQIERGEFTAIVGPSGCGKTTLLNMMGGLDKPSGGHVFIENQDIIDMRGGELVDFRLHNIGFIFQSYNLIPVLTVRENVGFIMELQGKKTAETESRVRYLLDTMGVGDKLDVRPKFLSGGQQQRVAVARALASKPKFILADEPTANLDSKSTETLLDIMAALNVSEQMTFVFSTHDQRVMDRAKRIVVLEDGKIISDTRK